MTYPYILKTFAIKSQNHKIEITSIFDSKNWNQEICIRQNWSFSTIFNILRGHRALAPRLWVHKFHKKGWFWVENILSYFWHFWTKVHQIKCACVDVSKFATPFSNLQRHSEGADGTGHPRQQPRGVAKMGVNHVKTAKLKNYKPLEKLQSCVLVQFNEGLCKKCKNLSLQRKLERSVRRTYWVIGKCILHTVMEADTWPRIKGA